MKRQLLLLEVIHMHYRTRDKLCDHQRSRQGWGGGESEKEGERKNSLVCSIPKRGETQPQITLARTRKSSGVVVKRR